MKKIVLLLFILSTVLYAEEGYTKLEITNSENYWGYKSELNKSNINVNDGLEGEIRYYFEHKSKFANCSVQIADTGFLKKVENSKIINKLAEAYISIDLNGNFIDAGKKKVSQSLGFLKNPIDFAMNTDSKDLSKSKDERNKTAEGKIMLNGEVFSGFGVFGYSYIPKIDIKDKDVSDYLTSSQNEMQLLRYSNNFEGTDIALGIAKDDSWKAGINTSTSFMDNSIMVYIEGAWFEKRDSIKDFDYADKKFDTVYEKRENSYELVFGGEYAIGDFDFRGEYVYNSSGHDKKEWDDLRDSLSKEGALIKGASYNNLFLQRDSYTLCRDYFMTRVEYKGFQDDKVSILGTVVMNGEDISGIGMLSLVYTGWNNVSFSVEPSFSFGESYSEYKMMGFDRGIKSELTVSF